MLSLAMALAAAPALAQDNTSSGGTSGGAASDDELPEDSVKSERDAVKSGKAEAKDEAPQGKEKIPFIKTIQRKNFMKIGRYEIGVDVGSVSNDPFLNRWIIGAVADYHFTELFALELQLGYAPNFDDPAGLRPGLEGVELPAPGEELGVAGHLPVDDPRERGAGLLAHLREGGGRA